MKRTVVATVVAAMLASPAVAVPTIFPLEFWPALPDRSKEIEAFFACPVGVRLDFWQNGPAPSNAAIGAFVFVGRGMQQYPGLYKIDRIELKRKPDGTVAEVRIGAICTTSLAAPQ